VQPSVDITEGRVISHQLAKRREEPSAGMMEGAVIRYHQACIGENDQPSADIMEGRVISHQLTRRREEPSAVMMEEAVIRYLQA
jgi:hypothetical protein